jgi:hypothetical protein
LFDSISRQLAEELAEMSAFSRRPFKALLNCSASGLLLNPLFDRIFEKRVPMWS